MCAGYAQSITFATRDDRRDAYHNREQPSAGAQGQLMSKLLLAQVSTKPAHTLLAEVEAGCEGISAHHNEHVNVQRGPFGAFKVLSPSVEHADSPDVSAFIANFFSNIDNLDDPDQIQRQLTPVHDSTWLNDSEEDDIRNFLQMQSSPLAEQSTAIQVSNQTSRRFGNSHAPLQFHNYSTSLLLNSTLSPTRTPQVLPTVEIAQNAPILLKYYADVVIPLLTPFKHGKTPWHILFLPLAKATLAGITIGEIQDDACLSAFYGTLSLSASHLFAACRNQKWSDQAEIFKDAAHQHIVKVQSKAYDLPKVFKYKVVVMMLLTMAQISVAEGQRDQTEHWLLEAERFIRLRGLRRPQKSRKVRLLHHCYAYMRIFHESLLSPQMLSDRRTRIQGMLEDNENSLSGQDNPSFRLTAWSNLDEKLREIKTRELGENDLHLSMPGLWTSTLYPEIWGIPESWMILLSQTIRLGNEKDPTDSTDDAAAMSLREYAQRAKALERCVLDWNATSHSTENAVSPDRHHQVSDIDWTTFNSALQALHHALIIYFYRRIHDFDARLLQGEVTKVRDSLFACRQHMHSGSQYLAGLVWPAFVAACEAVDVSLQNSFLEWFELCSHHNGQHSLNKMQEFVKSLWAKRKAPKGASVTWLDLLKGKSTLL